MGDVLFGGSYTKTYANVGGKQAGSFAAWVACPSEATRNEGAVQDVLPSDLTEKLYRMHTILKGEGGSVSRSALRITRVAIWAIGVSNLLTKPPKPPLPCKRKFTYHVKNLLWVSR